MAAAEPAAEIDVAFSNCSPEGSRQGSLEFGLSANQDASLTVDWTIKPASGANRSGSIRLDQDDPNADFVDVTGLPAGTVTVEIHEHGKAAVIDSAQLEVLSCVTVSSATCRATFTSSAGNPAVTVLADGASGLATGSLLQITPGGSRTAVSESSELTWIAIRSSDLEEPADTDSGSGSEDPITYNLAGRGTVAIRSCDTTFLTTKISCAASGQLSRISVDLPADTFRMRNVRLALGTITNPQPEFTIEGRGGGRHATFTFDTERLTSASQATRYYGVVLETKDGTQSVASRVFAVVDCVKVTVSCRSVTFSDPSTNPAAVITYSGGRVRVPAGAKRTVGSNRRTISWTGTAKLPKQDDPLVFDQVGTSPRTATVTEGHQVDLRRNCAVSAGNASPGLADTGSSSTTTVLGPVGLGAVCLGSVLLLMARRRRN